MMAVALGPYFHGGVRKLKVGERILPPKNTGAASNADYGGEGVTRRDRVYLHVDVDQARLYACMYPPNGRGWVYEAEPLGDIELDPDYKGPPGESISCPRARVVRVVERNVLKWQGLGPLELARRLGA